MITDGWQVDEEFVASVSVQLCEGSRHLGNGLLLDAETVVTVGAALGTFPGVSVSEHTVEVVTDERRVRAETVEIRPAPRLESPDFRDPYLAVLRLAEPVPVPDQPLAFDSRLMPGSELLVSAHAKRGQYSCLLDVKGRSGKWLRVAGELVTGLVGAPAFSSTGALAGLVTAPNEDEQRGLLLPIAALRALDTVRLDDRLQPGDGYGR